jgi:hypothetical protein
MLLDTCTFLSNIVSPVPVVLLQNHMLQEEVNHFHVATHNCIFSEFCLLNFQTAGNSRYVLFELMYCPTNVLANGICLKTLLTLGYARMENSFPISKREVDIIITNGNFLIEA